VALLGRYNSCGPRVLKLFKKIKRQHELCSDAEEKLERYIRQDIEDPEVARLNDRSKPLTFTRRLHWNECLKKIFFAGRVKIVAPFIRYTTADPLCCSSRVSKATYGSRRNLETPLWLWSVFEPGQLETTSQYAGHFTAWLRVTSPLGPFCNERLENANELVQP
jgi:hypothetical protein